MNALDVDGDGEVSKDEFRGPWLKLFPKMTPADFEKAWVEIDTNGDGNLDMSELAAYYGFNISPTTKRSGDASEMTDEQIMEALQLAATLEQLKEEQEVRKREMAEAKKREEEEERLAKNPGRKSRRSVSREGSDGFRTGGNLQDREAKKTSSGIGTIKIPAKVTHSSDDPDVEFMHMCELGDEKAIREALLKNKGQRIRIEDERGEMPIHKLARQGCLETMRELIEMLAKAEAVKTDLNWQDKQGKTPLFYAVEYGHVKIVQLCLDRGSDVMIENINGWTALHTAVNADKLDCAETLLVHPRVLPQKQRLLDASDKNERTALHVASFKSEGGEMVALLLKHGADPMAEDQIGNTGVKLAEKTGRRKSKELLEEHIQAAVKQAMPKIRAVNALKTT